MTREVFDFRIDVPDDEVVDLRDRLSRTRWPQQVAGIGWDEGTDDDYLRSVVQYWANDFSWRAQEARLNALPQYKVTSGAARGVHLVHLPGVGPDPLPLVLTHGWPSSFFEFCGIARMLADPGAHGGDPADAFHVIVPSIPGYGFSDVPAEPGVHPAAIADAFVDAVTELGYDRIGLHGGDWGAYLSSLVALRHPERVAGLHLTGILLSSPRADATPVDPDARARRKRWEERETGYQHIQRSRPQSLSYGLADSPAGLAGWYLEKWQRWTDCGGDLERCISRDQLLTNLSIYWFSNTAASANRLYREAALNPVRLRAGERVEVPCGFAKFPRESLRGRSAVERDYRVVHWTEMPRGGHFPALEQPDLLVDDLRLFFRALR